LKNSNGQKSYNRRTCLPAVDDVEIVGGLDPRRVPERLANVLQSERQEPFMGLLGTPSPCSGRDCVKSLRSSYTGLYAQTGVTLHTGLYPQRSGRAVYGGGPANALQSETEEPSMELKGPFIQGRGGFCLESPCKAKGTSRVWTGHSR
jgi:hypothetical protein